MLSDNTGLYVLHSICCTYGTYYVVLLNVLSCIDMDTMHQQSYCTKKKFTLLDNELDAFGTSSYSDYLEPSEQVRIRLRGHEDVRWCRYFCNVI